MSLVESSIRQFTFFDKVPVLDQKDAKENLRLKYKIDLWTSNENSVLFGGVDGTILQLSQDFEYQLWKSFDQRLFSFQLTADNILASIGLDDMKDTIPVIKIWDMSQWERNLPTCRCTSRVNLTKKNVALQTSAIAINSTHSLIAIGFADSSVFFLTGDFAKDKSSLPRFKSLREGANALGGGLLVGLAVATSNHKNNTSVVFVITNTSVTSYIIVGGNWKSTVSHNDKGCDPNCWQFSANKNQLIVAGREIVHFYDADSILETGSANGPCQALARGAEKLQFVVQGHHVALLTQQKTVNSESTTVTLTVYDVEFRFIAFSSLLKHSSQLFTLGNEIFVLDEDGALAKLAERSLNTKLEFLLKKNLFDVAIGLAKRYKSMDLYNLYKEYGDYLYGRSDFDNSIRQYMLTMGHIESSYVIRKFLDGSLIEQLCSYLELIHRKGMAVDEHTNLLIGAYVKMNNKPKILEFVKKSTNLKNFDLESAIKILRSSMLSEIAASLAVQHKRTDLYLSILISDLKNYEKAIDYIQNLPTNEICDNLELYSTVLIENCENDVVQLLSKIAFLEGTNLKKLVKVVMSKPHHLDTIFGNDLSKLCDFKDASIRNTILEYRLRNLTKKKTKVKTVLEEERHSIFSLVNAHNFNDALNLAQLYNYPPLIIYVLKKQERMDDMLRYLLKEGDINDVIEYCGEEALKSMWIELITYISSKKNIDTQYLASLLEKATTTNFVHPLVILEILSRNDSFKIGDVQQYIVKWLDKQTDLIIKKEVKVKEGESRIVDMTSTIDDLEHNKCSACDTLLSAPVMHFLCKHAYHLHCYEEYNTDLASQCPSCAFAIRRSNANRPDASSSGAQKSDLNLTTNLISHQQFRQELEECTDAIGLISQYISRGVFDT